VTGRACPACGGPLAAWRRAPAHEPGAAATHLLLRCSACGTAVTAGEPPTFSAAHEAGAYAATGAPRLAGAAAPVLRAFDHRRLGLLGDVGPGRLLDVGAGRGRFVAYARSRGWDATGIEPSRRSSAPFVEPVALEAFAPAAPYDAITVWHVLEHVTDPASALARVRAWLAPGATLVAGVPNLDSWQARVAGPHWYHLDLPRHRVHFTARGAATLLERCGFEVVRVEHLLLEHNPFGLWQSLLNRVTPTPSWLFHALKRNARLRPADAVPTALALPLVPLALAAEAAAGLARRGGTVALVARQVQ